MTKNDAVLTKTLARALTGKGAHVDSREIFEALDWKVAGTRPTGAPHSIFQLLNHVAFWQNWAVKWLEGKPAPLPADAAGSWPGEVMPAGKEEWDGAVKAFHEGLHELARLSRAADLKTMRGRKSRLEMLHTIAAHNSYHLGQAVLLRQMLGAWPPPSGGMTW